MYPSSFAEQNLGAKVGYRTSGHMLGVRILCRLDIAAGGVCCLPNRQSRLFCSFELDCVLKIVKKSLLSRTHRLATKTQESPLS